MATLVVDLPNMAPPKKSSNSRKQPDSKRSQGVDRHIRPRIAFHLPEDVHDALLALSKDNRRTITSELLIAVEEHLRASGRWPVPAKE